MNERFDIVIVSGDLPPGLGGVAQYCGQLGRALAERGLKVLLLGNTNHCEFDGVPCRRLDFGPSLLSAPLPVDADTWFLQWVPHAFGLKSLNLTVPAWASLRVPRGRLWTMFHEVALPAGPAHGLGWNAAAWFHRRMASSLVGSSSRVCVSTPSWRSVIPDLALAEWLPIPSTLTQPTASEVDEARARWGDSGRSVVHVGTFGGPLRPMVESLLREADARLPRDVRIVLAGRGSDDFLRDCSSVSGRVVATGPLPRHELSAVVSVADVALQPFPDGISTRRTSAMAALALGTPLVSNVGELSEPFWRSRGGPSMVESPHAVVGAALDLLRDEGARRRTAELQSSLYRESLSMQRTVDRLMGPPQRDWSIPW
jgi:hypothetical protein